jgi:branched-chain amino acid aminotransferase
LEEAGTMNVRINDTLFTAPTSEILDGIRKKSYGLKEGITVAILVLVSELVEASNGTLKEIFAGTAAVVNPIIGFSYQDVYYELPKLKIHMQMQLKIEQICNTNWLKIHWLDCKV